MNKMTRDPRKPYKPPCPKGARLIPLTQGQWTIVDADLYEWLNQWKWYADWDQRIKSYYAVRAATVAERADGKPTHIRMHRAILGTITDSKVHVDHVNHKTLDNRGSQLEPCTDRQNKRNKKNPGSSKYPNVNWDNSNNKWRVQLAVCGVIVHMGRFTREYEHEAGALAKIAQDYVDVNPDCTAQDLKDLRTRIRRGENAWITRLLAVDDV